MLNISRLLSVLLLSVGTVALGQATSAPATAPAELRKLTDDLDRDAAQFGRQRSSPTSAPAKAMTFMDYMVDNEDAGFAPRLTLVAKGEGYVITMVRVQAFPNYTWVSAVGKPVSMLTYTDTKTGEMRIIDKAPSMELQLHAPPLLPDGSPPPGAEGKLISSTAYCHYLQAIADGPVVYLLERMDIVVVGALPLNMDTHVAGTQLILAAVPIAKDGSVQRITIDEKIKFRVGSLGVPEVEGGVPRPVMSLKDGMILVGQTKGEEDRFTFDGKKFTKKEAK